MKHRKKLVALTGAGISAESGLKTFRDSGGLWEDFDVMEVASIDGWRRDPEKVHRFYDLRRKQAFSAEPNEGHRTLARLEQHFDVHVVTQNVDRLHEKAGSTRVLHLHGDLHTARCTSGGESVRELGADPLPHNLPCGAGGVWRPNIVWFGEEVPNMKPAITLVQQADVLLIVGTSLQVYPAAGLLSYARFDADIWLADPAAAELSVPPAVRTVSEPASIALPKIEALLLSQHLQHQA